MKALVQYGYGGVEVLRLEDRRSPTPGPKDVLLRVLACGVNGSDWEFVRGVPYYAKLAGGSPRGRVLGSDICGVIEAVGTEVAGFAVGQRVVAETLGSFGGFAEMAVAPADRCVPLPEGMDPVLAAALPQSGAVALAGMGDLVRAGQHVLINGAGGAAGPFAVQLALAAGARVTAVDCAAKLPMLTGLGAHRVMDYAVEDFAQDFAQDGSDYDVILDLWGTRGVGTVRRCLKPGGFYYFVGGPMPVFVSMVIWGGLSSLFSDRKVKLLLAPLGATRLPEILEAGQSGLLKPVISAQVPLAEAREALNRMGAGDLPGKLVITP